MLGSVTDFIAHILVTRIKNEFPQWLFKVTTQLTHQIT